MNSSDSSRMRVPFRSLTLVFLAVISIWLLRQSELQFVAISSAPYLDQEISYQMGSLLILAGLVGALALVAPDETKAFARLGQVNADVTPEPRIRLTPSENETWVHIGITFTVIITGVTTIVVGLTQFDAVSFNPELLLLSPWIVVFAASNALVEEGIFRLGVVVSLVGYLAPAHIALVSGIIFGGVHYFGVAPQGFAGLLLAGFIGWFLAKSVLETHGLFWAWTIHFVQDLVLFSFILAMKI